MKYRRLTQDGDMQFGHGAADFYADQPEAVAQAVVTRLRLYTGDWFLDATEGTDWMGSVLGTGTAGLYDAHLRARIAETRGVTGIDRYRSARDGDARALAVAATINTAYGDITFAAPVVVNIPPAPAGQALVGLLGQDGALLFGADGELLIGPTDPSLLVFI